MKQKKYRILNVFDLVVIALCVVLAAVYLLGRNGGTAAVVGSSRTVTYTIELTYLQNSSGALIQPGNKLIDNVKKYDMGEVTAVRVEPSTQQVQDFVNGGYHAVESQRLETAYLTVTAPCTETDTEILVNGEYLIRVGTSVSVKGEGYFGTGYVLAIDRED